LARARSLTSCMLASPHLGTTSFHSSPNKAQSV
jgi:hypothetical protein